MLGRDGRVVALGEDVQQLGAPLGGALDLEPDLIKVLVCHHYKTTARAHYSRPPRKNSTITIAPTIAATTAIDVERKIH